MPDDGTSLILILRRDYLHEVHQSASLLKGANSLITALTCGIGMRNSCVVVYTISLKQYYKMGIAMSRPLPNWQVWLLFERINKFAQCLGIHFFLDWMMWWKNGIFLIVRTESSELTIALGMMGFLRSIHIQVLTMPTWSLAFGLAHFWDLRCTINSKTLIQTKDKNMVD